MIIPIFIPTNNSLDIELTEKDFFLIGLIIFIGGILAFGLGYYLHQDFLEKIHKPKQITYEEKL